MAIKSSQGFTVSSTEPIDSRFVMTKAEMLAIKKAAMPAYYIVLCSDDGKLYIYDRSITTPSEETGRFTLIDSQIFANVRFTALESVVGDTSSGLVKDVAGAKQDITALQDTVNSLKLDTIPGTISGEEIL